MATLALIFCKQVGITQMSKMNFNSLCRLDNGTTIGVSSSGIFAIDSGDDDNGNKIDAFIEFPSTDFNLPNQKKLRKIFLGIEADGNMTLSVKPDGGSFIESKLDVDVDSSREEGIAAPFRRDVRGRYLVVKISNTNGCYFFLGSIDVELMLGSTRAGRIHFFEAYLSSEFPMLSCVGTGS